MVRFTQCFLRMTLAKIPQGEGPVFPYKSKKPGLPLADWDRHLFQE